MKQQKIPDNAVVIVLGAQVFRTRLSGTLYNRVEAAADHLRRYPQAKCITTGGQGKNEPRTEGDAAKEVLVQMGIGSDRVYAETRSATTWENLRYARDILLREGLGREVLLSTQKFHQWRAGKMAQRLGLKPYPLVAADRPGTKWKHTSREGLAIIKFLLFNRKNER